MSNTETHAVTGRSVRRLTGRPGSPGEHLGRTHARTTQTPRNEGAVLELTLLDVFEATVASVPPWTRRAVSSPTTISPQR
jgi:hypothetical protein